MLEEPSIILRLPCLLHVFINTDWCFTTCTAIIIKSTKVQTLGTIWLKCSNIWIENIFACIGWIQWYENWVVSNQHQKSGPCSILVVHVIKHQSVLICRRQGSLRMMLGSPSIINPRRACARGLQYLVCLSVCLCVCVCVCVFPILAPRAIRRTNSSISDFSAIRAWNIKRDFSLKRFVPKLWRRLLTSSSSGVVSGILVPFFRRN